MTEQEKQIIDYYNKGYTQDEIKELTGYRKIRIKEAIKNNRDKINREKVVRGNRAILITAISDGITDIRTLQDMTGLARTTIYKYSNVGRRKPHYNHGHTADIVADLQAGEMTQSEIARKYGVSRQAVFKAKKYL